MKPSKLSISDLKPIDTNKSKSFFNGTCFICYKKLDGKSVFECGEIENSPKLCSPECCDSFRHSTAKRQIWELLNSKK